MHSGRTLADYKTKLREMFDMVSINNRLSLSSCYPQGLSSISNAKLPLPSSDLLSKCIDSNNMAADELHKG
jgi:hypothetical protein